MKLRIPKILLLVLLLSLLPVIHMFVTQQIPHTSDGEAHLGRMASYYKEITAGQFPVRWSGSLNYGYGVPVFNYYYPLPAMVAVPFIAAGFSLGLVLKISFALTYLLAGIFMYIFAKEFFEDEKVAFFVTIMYQFAPFRLVEMLVRGNIGTLYSYALLPLLLFTVVKLYKKTTYIHFIIASVVTSLLIMSHNLIGFIYFSITGLFVLFNLKNYKKWIPIFGSMICGIFLTSFFIFPAILEQKYTNGYVYTKDLFYDHFPTLVQLFTPNFFNIQSLRVAEVSVQIGIIHASSLLFIVFLLFKNKLQDKWKKFIWFLLGLSVLTILFMNSITKPIWENIHILRQFQYPWRLLSVIVVTTALASALVVNKLPIFKNKIYYALLIIFVVISTAVYWKPLHGYRTISEEYYWNYPKSTAYLSELNSIWMAADPIEYPKERIEIVNGNGTIQNLSKQSIKHSFNINADSEVTILDKTIFYPGWKARVDGAEVPIEFQDINYRGLITFKVPAGEHNIEVVYAQSKLQQLSNILSVITIALVAFGYFIRKSKLFSAVNRYIMN